MFTFMSSDFYFGIHLSEKLVALGIFIFWNTNHHILLHDFIKRLWLNVFVIDMNKLKYY